MPRRFFLPFFTLSAYASQHFAMAGGSASFRDSFVSLLEPSWVLGTIDAIRALPTCHRGGRYVEKTISQRRSPTACLQEQSSRGQPALEFTSELAPALGRDTRIAARKQSYTTQAASNKPRRARTHSVRTHTRRAL